MDTVYPEPLSRLYRRAVPKKRPRGNGGRFRTQPITFAEIQEVDEDNIEETSGTAAMCESKSEIDLNAKFEEFRRLSSLDLDMSEMKDSILKTTNAISPSKPDSQSFHNTSKELSRRFTNIQRIEK